MVSLSPLPAHDATPALHVMRGTRADDRILAECELSSQDLARLGANNLGLFAGGYGTIGMMERRLMVLAQSAAACHWIVAVATQQLLTDTIERLRSQPTPLSTSTVEGRPVRCRLENLRLTTVEQLATFNGELFNGLILYDPACHVHRARSFTRYDGNNHDRAQLVANFISSQRAKGAGTTLCLMTLRPAMAVGTARVADAYMQDGWWFVTPNSLRFTDT